MRIEAGLAAGAALLFLAAAAASGAAWRSGSRRAHTLARIARLLAAALLLAAILAAAQTQGGWSTFDLRQAALGLALAVTLVHLALILWSRLDNPLTDLSALALALGAAVVILPGAPPLDCVHHLPLHRALWLVVLLGSGGLVVAGSGGLALALTALADRRDGAWPRRARLHTWLKEATQIGLAFLGLGLALLALATWRAVGSLTGGDQREAWLAAAWLIAAMSWQAWQLGRRAARWAGLLALIAAAVVLLALLALPDLIHLVGG